MNSRASGRGVGVEQGQTQPTDVYLLIRASDGDTRWMNVTEYLKTESKRRKSPVRWIVFDAQPSNALNLMRLRDRLLLQRD